MSNNFWFRGFPGNRRYKKEEVCTNIAFCNPLLLRIAWVDGREEERMSKSTKDIELLCFPVLRTRAGVMYYDIPLC